MRQNFTSKSRSNGSFSSPPHTDADRTLTLIKNGLATANAEKSQIEHKILELGGEQAEPLNIDQGVAVNAVLVKDGSEAQRRLINTMSDSLNAQVGFTDATRIDPDGNALKIAKILSTQEMLKIRDGFVEEFGPSRIKDLIFKLMEIGQENFLDPQLRQAFLEDEKFRSGLDQKLADKVIEDESTDKDKVAVIVPSFLDGKLAKSYKKRFRKVMRSIDCSTDLAIQLQVTVYNQRIAKLREENKSSLASVTVFFVFLMICLGIIPGLSEAFNYFNLAENVLGIHGMKANIIGASAIVACHVIAIIYFKEAIHANYLEGRKAFEDLPLKKIFFYAVFITCICGALVFVVNMKIQTLEENKTTILTGSLSDQGGGDDWMEEDNTIDPATKYFKDHSKLTSLKFWLSLGFLITFSLALLISSAVCFAMAELSATVVYLRYMRDKRSLAFDKNWVEYRQITSLQEQHARCLSTIGGFVAAQEHALRNYGYKLN